jgi:ABC-type lipoprotein release transport system permease subunit
VGANEGDRPNVTAVLYRSRALLRRRWRAWMGLGLVIGVFGGLAMALADGAHRSYTAYPKFVAAMNTADLVMAGEGSFGLVGSVDLDDVEKLPQVDAAARAFATLPFSATIQGRPERYGTDDLFPVASADQRLGHDIETWKIVEGRAADPTRVDEATASFELAERIGLEVGETMKFHFYDAEKFDALSVELLSQWPDRLKELQQRGTTDELDPANGPRQAIKIVGIEASSLEFPPLITDLAPVLHLTPAFHERYARVVGGSPIDYIQLRDPSELGEFQQAVERLADGKPVSFVSTLENQRPKVERSLHAEALILAILAGLVALAGMIAIAQAVVRQAFVESGDDDTLRALGLQPSQFLGIAACRSVCIAIVGAIVAGALAWLAAPSFSLSLARTANLDTGFPLDPVVTLVGVGVVVAYAVGAGVWGASLVARRARRRKHRPTEVPRTRQWTTRLSPLQSGLPLGTLLGVRFATQRHRRSAPAWTAVAGTAACVAIVVFASTFITHLHRDLSEKHRYGWNWDVKIGAPALPDIVGVVLSGPLRDQPDITDLSVGAVTQIDVGGTRVDALGLDRLRGAAEPTILDGRAPRDAGEIVLGTRTMRMLDTGLGRIIAARVGAAKATYRVVGVAVFPEFGDSGQLGTGSWMTIEGLRRVLPEAPRDLFYIRFGGAADPQERAEQMTRVLAPLPSRDDARPEDLVNLARGDGLLVALGALVGLLALAMLVHTVVTAVRGGRRSHATLRALGFSRNQSRMTVLWQTITLAAAAFAVGLPAGLIAGRVVWTAFADSLGLAADSFIPPATVLVTAVGMLVVALLAAIPPAWLVTRGDVARTLQSRI